MNDGESNIGSPLAVVVLAQKHNRFAAVDIMDAAWFRGELQPLWREFLVGLANERDPQGMAPTSEVLQSFSEQIRYNHDLITSEETEAWLRSHRLSLNDLTDFCHRRYWLEHATNPPPVANIDYLDAAAALREMFIKDLFFAGNFDELIRRAAWRLAASLSTEAEPPVAPDQVEAQRARFFQRSHLDQKTLPEALQHIGRDRAWFEGQIELEARYQRHCARVSTTENRARSLVALRLPLTRIELEMLDLESEDAAREACFCLETDGLSMTELAEQEHYRIERQELLLEDFSEDVQPQFAGAEPGQVRQITTPDFRYRVCRVLGKREPSLADENVVRRIDEELLTAHFENLLSQHRVWQIKPGSPS